MKFISFAMSTVHLAICGVLYKIQNDLEVVIERETSKDREKDLEEEKTEN